MRLDELNWDSTGEFFDEAKIHGWTILKAKDPRCHWNGRLLQVGQYAFNSQSRTVYGCLDPLEAQAILIHITSGVAET